MILRQTNWIQNLVMVTALVLFLSLTSGCSGFLIHQALNPKDAQLTPEQIDAYAKVGADVWSCTVIGGPPPLGSMIFITAPKTAKMSVQFGDGCHLIVR